MNANRVLELVPKTRAGKNRLQNKVNRWKVLEESSFAGRPAVLLQELREDTMERTLRWVLLGGVDENFDVRETGEDLHAPPTPEAPTVTLPSPDEFRKMLAAHDPDFGMSDDPRVFREGSDRLRQILDCVDRSPALLEVFREFCREGGR